MFRNGSNYVLKIKFIYQNNILIKKVVKRSVKIRKIKVKTY